MKILPFAVSLLLLIGCSTEEPKTVEPTNTEEVVENTIEPVYPDFNFDTLVGSFEGDFAGSPIRININFASNKHATGYNIHKGLIRNISGKITEDSNSVFLTLAEPGENEFDGVFHLTVNREDLKMSGTWTPNNENLKGKSFDLERTEQDLEWKKLNRAENLIYGVAEIGDTIGDFFFLDDGLVRYEYYPTKDDIGHKEQMETVLGVWTIADDTTIIVNWEKNAVFESRSSTFNVREENQYSDYETYAVMNNRTLYPNYP